MTLEGPSVDDCGDHQKRQKLASTRVRQRHQNGGYRLVEHHDDGGSNINTKNCQRCNGSHHLLFPAPSKLQKDGSSRCRQKSASPSKRNCESTDSASPSPYCRQMLSKPRMWSFSFLMMLTFVVASACTFLINAAAFLCLSPLTTTKGDFPIRSTTAAAAALRGGRSSRQGAGYYYAPRVASYLVTDEETDKVTTLSWFRTTLYYSYRQIFRCLAGRGQHRRTIVLDYPPNPDVVPQGVYDAGYDEGCIPKSDWQMSSYPNCNTVHEISLMGAGEANDEEGQLSVLGEGWFRTTWMVQSPALFEQPNNETTVLKTLRIERDFTTEFYELHRKDAVALERLTSSKFVVDVYGFCGQSTINEMADFPYVEIRDLEKFDRRLRGMHFDPKAVLLKLQVAASIAQGVADIHSIDGDPSENGLGATMVHYDLNPRNIAMFKQGRPKINDFNIAEFLRYDPQTNKTCGFPNRMHQPWWRAPEEVSLTAPAALDEKVDVFSLGSILFHILTTHSPRGKMKDYRMEEVRAMVLQGIEPKIPEPFASDNSTATAAFKKAMSRCFVKDPAHRASAQEVLEILLDALEELVAEDRQAREKQASGAANGIVTTKQRRRRRR